MQQQQQKNEKKKQHENYLDNNLRKYTSKFNNKAIDDASFKGKNK